jgi:demethylmenaquinone methyltransferase / 2-methoxy-6-polyprenyl-1,4-benzoquinol methylase
MGEEMADFGFRKVPAREKAGYVRRHFNSVVGTYDFMNTLLSLGLHHLWKRAAVQGLGLAVGERVIDVCGGTADLSLLAARAVGPSGRVVLTDINRAMITAGAAKVAKATLAGRIVAVQGDAESLPFLAESFDAVIVGFGIRNLTRMEQGMAEMHRVLRLGGRMIFLECSLPISPWFGPLYHFYSFQIMPLAGKWLAGNREAYLHLPESIQRFPPPDRIAALFEGVGFSAVTYRRLTKGIAVIYRGTKA